MLTQRDKNILIFIENHGAITVNQCTEIFFKGNYRGCARRLQELQELGHLESYISKGKQKVYKFIEAKELSQHNLYLLDLIAWIYSNGGEVTEIKKTPHFLKGILIPDAYIKFDLPYNNEIYEITALIEIDFTHYTSEVKLNTWYEKIFREKIIEEECILIICRPTKGLIYRSRNFETIYTDLQFTNLLRLIFE